MAHFSNIFKFDIERELAFGGIAAGFNPVGTELEFPAVGYIVVNGTDSDLTFSFDGIDPHFTLLMGVSYIQDVTTNKTKDDGIFLKAGSRLYVRQKSGAPTLGYVTFSVMYAQKI